MLDERTTIDQIEVKPETGHIQVRQRKSIVRITEIVDEGGKPAGTSEEEVSYTYHRYVLEPGADLSDEPEAVKAIAEAAWASLE